MITARPLSARGLMARALTALKIGESADQSTSAPTNAIKQRNGTAILSRDGNYILLRS